MTRPSWPDTAHWLLEPTEHPDATLVLAASSGATTWSDFPGFTRVKGPGCYAFEVSTPSGTEQIIFSFV